MRTEPKSTIILDTNVLISAALFSQSVPADLLEGALDHYVPVFTLAIWNELAQVIMREKLNHYLTQEARHLFLAKLASMIDVVESRSAVNNCRDPKDNKFLALAIDAKAVCIVTGDSDLLALHLYRSITVCTPAEFLAARPEPP